MHIDAQRGSPVTREAQIEAMAKSVSRRSKTHGRKSQQPSSLQHSPDDDDVSEASEEILRASKAVNPVKKKSTSRGRAAAEWLSMLVSLMFGMWWLFRYQTEVLPPPVSEGAAGIRGFSEERAYRHVKALTSLGPHPLGSDALNRAIQVLRAFRFLFEDFNLRFVLFFGFGILDSHRIQ